MEQPDTVRLPPRCAALALALTLAGAPLAAQQTSFYTVAPCRLLDTRGPTGPLGGPALAAGASREFAAGGQCGISTRAVAVSANVTVTGAASAGFLAFGAGGASAPPTNTISFGAGQVRANNAVLQLGGAGAVTAFANHPSGTVQVVVDVNGYFADPAQEQMAAAPPAYNPPPGNYPTGTAVQLASSTPGAQLFYTTDGSTPSASHGTLYSGAAVPISQSTLLQAIAVKAGLTASPVTAGQYTFGLQPTLLLATLTPQGSASTLAGGTGSLVLAGDQASAVLHYSYSNLSGPIIAQHIHGPGGVILFDLDTTPPDATGGRLWTLVPVGTLSVAQIQAALLGGQCYLNLHTAAYPSGEIKGFFNVSTGNGAFTPPPPPPALPPPPVTQTDAARFLLQATYGPATSGEVTTLASDPLGFAPWLAAQFSQPLVAHQAYVDAARAAGETISSNQVMESLWKQAVTGPDQLRQRVTLALSEIMVISDVGEHVQPDGMANYLDVLERDAFGNFRQLLADVTLTPAMGAYLNMLGNDKGNPAQGRNPNENYAREIMQLFSIGLYQLNPDGTLILDASGLPVPTYDQNAVMGMAQVFTGWTYAGGDHTHSSNFFHVAQNWRQPMESWPDHHSTGSKQLLGGAVLPAGQTPEQDLNAALDQIFNHPNAGPFLCRGLIQRLVTGNPSPAYVYRCGLAFANNGQGVRGDLQAVLRAILLDYEARSVTFLAQPGYGHLREPVVRLGALLRALHATPPADGKFRLWDLQNPQYGLDQNPLRSPTVFNFFSPIYVLPGAVAQAGLVAPEFEITDETTVFGTADYWRSFLFHGLRPAPYTITPDYSALVPLADANLLAELNLVLMANGMSPTMQSTLLGALANPAFSSRSDPALRVKNLVWLIALSPQFVVQR